MRHSYIFTIVLAAVAVVGIAAAFQAPHPEETPAHEAQGRGLPVSGGVVQHQPRMRPFSADPVVGGITIGGLFGNAPLCFVENRGQLHQDVSYCLEGTDKTAYFTPYGVTFALTAAKEQAGYNQRWVVKQDYVGAEPSRPTGQEPTGANISYFKGQPEDWMIDLTSFRKLIHRDLWPGIDLVYTGLTNRLKYDFVVKPGADPNLIRLVYRGATGVTIDKAGQLVVSTPLGSIVDGTPFAYQQIEGQLVEVPSCYNPIRNSTENGFEYGFSLGRYDPTQPLIIDPEIRMNRRGASDRSAASGGNYAKSGLGDVEVRLNGGDDVAYIGDTNIVEFWIMNDAVLTAMSLGLEFSIGRTYQFDPNHGGASKYVQEKGDAVGAWDSGLLEVVSIDNLSSDSIGIGGVVFVPGSGLPVHMPQALCYTMAVYIDPGQDELVNGFCVDNIFMQPSVPWSFNDDAGSYAPDFQGHPNSSENDPDAPEVCFDIVHGQQEIWWKEPNGIYMPDFDQNQSGWQNFCGPTAAADCLWWFHLLHPEWNLVPAGVTAPDFVEQLAELMSTNVAPSSGTHVDSMQSGIRKWLYLQNCHGELAESTYYMPTYEFCRDELMDCHDVILLLGFWEVQQIIPDMPQQGCFEIHWERIGGHFTTMAGVDEIGYMAGLSDPDKDAAETSLIFPPSRVLGPNHNHPTGHNDGISVSHDVYDVSTLGISPGGLWEMPDYYYITKGTSIDKYGPGTNPNPQAKSRQVTIWCDDLPPWVYPTAKVTEVEAAVVVYPRPPVRDTVTCEPQSGPDSTHPSTYFYDVTPGEFGRCDFHVRVYDSIESNYSNWVQPNGWQHALHKVGSAWWVSWYNPPCDNAIFSKFRFQFDNDNEAVWGDWTTTIDGSIDPYAQLIDSAGNHSSESNGYGYRVHVPKMTPLVDSAISLDTVIGSYDGDLVAGEDLKFVMRLTYNPGSNLNGINNGFRVYSPDGATWQPIVGDTINLGWSGIFDLGPFINYNSANGSGADTVGFNAAAILQGMTAPFDNQVWWIQTKVSDADSGKHLCVDSSFYNPGGNWVWAVQSGTFIFPSWDGPHCFQITGSQTQPDGGDLAYCGYVGGSSGDLGHAVAVDAEGCAYITGGTLSSSSQGFPVKVGPDPTYNYYGDVFVAKVSPEGDSLIYCGYIGGEWSDAGCGIAVDAEGCAYVTGYTESQYGFPTIVGPDYGLSGTRDAFAAKLNASGTSLVYCGYIGGWGEGLGEVGYDEGRAIAVDVEGCAYISGFTNSDQNYWSQLAVGPDLTYNGGEYDAFVTKVAADGSGLIFCGYVGGSGDDYGYGIAVDDGQYPYVTGYTNSTESTFPTHIGPDLTHNGTNDAFVTKVDYMGTGFVYSGFIGGSNQDYGHGITVDLQGAAYVAGDAFSTEVSFPVEVGPDLTQNGSNDAFIAKVMVNGTGLTYCGYIGGEDFESGYGVAIDATGNAYVTGKTWSTQASFPVIQGPDLTFNGASDGYVAKVNAAGTALDYCGYIGGAADEQGNGVAVDQIGNAYIAGSINSDEASFPVEIGPDLTHNGGGSDAFVAKVSVSVSCCMPPLRGNIDYDPGDLIDISDLVYLVDYMFTGGPAPHCMEEADINGDGQHDIADLVFLVDYMFSGGPDPAGCGKSGSLCAPSEADPGVTLLFDYADGYTTISLDADIAIRGLQLELVGDGDGVVRKLGGDQIDMVSGSDGRVVKIGILDLDGPMTLEAGSCEIASLKGRYTVTEALAVDKSIRKVLPTVLASANGPSLPSHFVLHQNYPNPFNPTTEIGFALPRACHVSLNIYNVLGQRVTTLLNERLEAGHHFQEWHANGAASGVYFYRIRAEDFVQTKKMMLLK